jgi:NAD(P)-dependent dehydrogenase (short-subunit alcohol dehydrogenase family)
MISAITEHLRPRTGDTAEKFKEERIASTSPQKRLLESAEIAYMAVYLASDEARGVTGQAMNIDGGLVLF